MIPPTWVTPLIPCPLSLADLSPMPALTVPSTLCSPSVQKDRPHSSTCCNVLKIVNLLQTNFRNTLLLIQHLVEAELAAICAETPIPGLAKTSQAESDILPQEETDGHEAKARPTPDKQGTLRIHKTGEDALYLSQAYRSVPRRAYKIQTSMVKEQEGNKYS